MNLYDRCVVLVTKFVAFFSKAIRIGAGATWPGEVALRLDPQVLKKFSQQGKKIIFIAGTNGKTTTAKMIETILASVGIRSRRNESGANLDNGLVSTFLADCLWNGTLISDYFIFEVDEATLPNILAFITPSIIVLTNLFRDQLDRYGEVDTIAEKWQKVLVNIPTDVKIIANGDDPHLVFVSGKLQAKVKYFGLEEPSLYLSKMQHATDTIYCPRCGNRLTFGGVYFSHLGKWACGKCGLTHPPVEISTKDFESPLEGVYNKYNTLAASMVAQSIGISDEEIRDGLAKFSPAFGRMEEIDRDGKRIKILLSKNPTGFNESIRTILNSNQIGPILFVLNDRIPDGTDISWIWDVDFEMVKEHKEPIFVSGDRVFDMALRLKYAEVPCSGVYNNLEEAVSALLKETKSNQMAWILPTYSAMLDVRKILTGRKIL